MKKKLLLAGATLVLSAAAATCYKTCQNIQMTDLMQANLEALSQSEGVEDCDIYKYNRNQAESKEIKPVQGNISTGFYIMFNGRRIDLGASMQIGTSVQVCVCIDSRGNCCAKSWLNNPIKYW